MQLTYFDFYCVIPSPSGCVSCPQTPRGGHNEQHVPWGRTAPDLTGAAAPTVQRGAGRPCGTGLHQLSPCHRPQNWVRCSFCTTGSPSETQESHRLSFECSTAGMPHSNDMRIGAITGNKIYISTYSFWVKSINHVRLTQCLKVKYWMYELHCAERCMKCTRKCNAFI